MESNCFEKPQIEAISLKEKLTQFAHSFLGEEIEIIDQENFSKIIEESEKQFELEKNNVIENSKNINYDKYHNTFDVGKEKNVSMGSVVGARRWGIDVALNEELKQSGSGKKVCKIILENEQKSFLFKKLNKELAQNLAQKTKHQDVLKSKAYEQIAERSEIESRQFGVAAEKIIIGVLEGLAIDRSDLGFSVLEANAFQDVENKIDFILVTKKKKRGVGVNREEVIFEEKSIGIQFTTNVTKFEHKTDQINKAKERGVEVDDIVYIEIDKGVLQEAINKWKDAKKPISGPWNFLPLGIRTKVFTNLFSEILSEEQQKSLLKSLK